MFRLLIDTCVWIELVRDAKQATLLAALEQLSKHRLVELLMPRTVLEEFTRNKARAIAESNRSLSGHLKQVKSAAAHIGDRRQVRSMMRHLNELDHRLPQLGDTAIKTAARIEALFKEAVIIETTEQVMLRAAKRAVDKRAPFHHAKNSMNDAILIETYADCIGGKGKKGVRYAFVSHNVKDFSLPSGNQKVPHPDLAGLFSKVRSLYLIKLGDALKKAAPDMFDDIQFIEEYDTTPRTFAEISEWEGKLTAMVWYNRHHNTRYLIHKKKVKIVDKPYDWKDQRKIMRHIWEGALKAAARTERELGPENLGPWTDFEWGMINGKLSALRWVGGDEWDMLDT